uniref:EOG090X0JQ4 n=1 Tax=Daphnia atkinsoni TaxID=342845 RepID=A0A4Y7M2H1_9CRUS|nr:EOG090X0JQ4 [Daphnia atkinsoni]
MMRRPFGEEMVNWHGRNQIPTLTYSWSFFTLWTESLNAAICSVTCSSVHKELPCEKPNVDTPSENLPGEHLPLTYKFPTVDTVPVEKLLELAHSDELKECLSNPHVRNILKSLVLSQTPEASIKDAMKEPIFLELAHACLKIVEPEKFHELVLQLKPSSGAYWAKDWHLSSAGECQVVASNL